MKIFNLVPLIILCFSNNAIALKTSKCKSNVALGDISDIVEKIRPSVVAISTQTSSSTIARDNFFYNFFQSFSYSSSPKNSKTVALGSGFFIDAIGHIVTNNHVIENADIIDIKTEMESNKIYKAKVVGRDKKTDLALLKIKYEGHTPFVNFGDSDCLRVANTIYAIGNPLGYGGTVTSGIVSYIGRYLNLENNLLSSFIQTDTPINKGSSGGPMFNVHGDVIGVSTAIASISGGNIGIGFAIPANIAKHIIRQLQEAGKIKRAWLGIKFQPITEDIARGLKLSKEAGIIVTNVFDNSPAKKAGILVGDVIYKFNENEITNFHILPMLIAETDPSQLQSFTINRNGKTFVLNIRLEIATELKPAQNKNKKQLVFKTFFGINVTNITEEIKKYYEITHINSGVIIISVDRLTEAYKQGLRPGDIVVSVNSIKVNTVKQMQGTLKNLASSVIVLLVNRKGYNRYVSIPLDN